MGLTSLILMGDEGIAREFLKKGDDALQKNDISKAIELYKKGLKESSDLPEAHFKLGDAYLKTGNKQKARRYFEECLRLLKEIPKPSTALQSLMRETNNRLTNLNKNRQELIALEKKYIEQLLNLARRSLKKDIPLTESILKLVLYLDPLNSDGAKLSQDLKQSRFVEPLQLLFNGKDLIDWDPQEPSVWKIENNMLLCDTHDSLINYKTKLNLGKEYKLLMEFKINEIYENDTIGFIIGNKGEEKELITVGISDSFIRVYWISSLVKEGKKRLKQAKELGQVPPQFDILNWTQFTNVLSVYGLREGKDFAMKEGQLPQNFKISEWNTLVLDVSSTNLKGYLNDKLVLEYKASKEDFFSGGCGILVQRANAQIKKAQYYLKEEK